MEIDRSSPVPLYAQIQDIIRRELLTEGAERPDYTTGVLAKHFGVNRLTVRRAIEELNKEGLMYSVKGVGTFACRNKTIEGKVDSLSSSFDKLTQRGYKVSAQVRRLEWVMANGQVAAALKIALGSKVLLIERLRFADDQPLGIDYRYVCSPWADVLTFENVEKSVIHPILAEEAK